MHGIHNLAPDQHLDLPLRLWDCGVAWRDLNPSEGVFVFDRLDAIMASTNKALLVLSGTPQWAARNPDQEHFAPWVGPGSNSAPRDSRVWQDFVRRVSQRYKGRLDYQIWNEPQLADFWYPYSDVRILAEMTKVAYNAIKFHDPKAKVVAAPVLPRASSGGMRRARSYLSHLREVKWPVDVFAVHCYPEPTKGPLRVKSMLTSTRSCLRDLGAPDRPLWITEINYNLLAGPIPDYRVGPYMLATNKVMGELKVARAYWYAYGHGNPEIFGIPFTDGSAGMQTLRYLS